MSFYNKNNTDKKITQKTLLEKVVIVTLHLLHCDLHSRVMMNSFRNPSELMKTLIALCVLWAYTYGLGIYSNAADSNSIYEIIVDDHISPSKDEIRYITPHSIRFDIIYIED